MTLEGTPLMGTPKQNAFLCRMMTALGYECQHGRKGAIRSEKTNNRKTK